jgi:UDPglucose--hexose-1-phosphate uridylyltransferase
VSAGTNAPRVFSRRLLKPDGRALWLYGRAPIPDDIEAPAPGAARDARSSGATTGPNPHLRWHPLRGEWVVYAGHRQERTFLPPAEYDPLAPSADPTNPTELPAGAYDVAVFENRFPTLHGAASLAAADAPPGSTIDTAPARGVCEVVVYTQDARGSLGELPLWHVDLVLAVWADRTAKLGARDDVRYVMPFENRGVQVGVTLHHPHGQIYAYPFVPPIPARELALAEAHRAQTGGALLSELVVQEQRAGVRVVVDAGRCLAFIPAFARYAYEVWIAPRAPSPRLDALDDATRLDFARALKTVLQKLDALFGAPMPYVLVVHQAPTDGAPHPEAHVHVEIYPTLRMKGRLKYLAGSELGAGTFTADTLPEEKAAELAAVEVPS